MIRLSIGDLVQFKSDIPEASNFISPIDENGNPVHSGTKRRNITVPVKSALIVIALSNHRDGKCTVFYNGEIGWMFCSEINVIQMAQ